MTVRSLPRWEALPRRVWCGTFLGHSHTHWLTCYPWPRPRNGGRIGWLPPRPCGSFTTDCHAFYRLARASELGSGCEQTGASPSLSLSMCLSVCLSLIGKLRSFLKKHQEHSLEVRDFHQVALAAFQTVPIHPAAEPAWAHGVQTILSPDFCPCSIPRPLNQHNGSAALSRASGARGGECADELRGRVGGAGMPESPPVTCPGLGPPGILKRAAQRPRDARNR